MASCARIFGCLLQTQNKQKLDLEFRGGCRQEKNRNRKQQLTETKTQTQKKHKRKKQLTETKTQTQKKQKKKTSDVLGDARVIQGSLGIENNAPMELRWPLGAQGERSRAQGPGPRVL